MNFIEYKGKQDQWSPEIYYEKQLLAYTKYRTQMTNLSIWVRVKLHESS